MARIVNNPDWSREYHSREKYPYDEWFDGKARHLFRGEDFNPEVDTMRITILAAATRRGITVRTKIIDNSTIQVQAQ